MCPYQLHIIYWIAYFEADRGYVNHPAPWRDIWWRCASLRRLLKVSHTTYSTDTPYFPDFPSCRGASEWKYASMMKWKQISIFQSFRKHFFQFFTVALFQYMVNKLCVKRHMMCALYVYAMKNFLELVMHPRKNYMTCGVIVSFAYFSGWQFLDGVSIKCVWCEKQHVI